MEKRNGMCPLCYLKQWLLPVRKVGQFRPPHAFDNGAAATPPMGWSSWNTFKNNITESLMDETAQAMIDKGLADAGYRYLNLDDCWHSSERDDAGNLQGDLERFPGGIGALVTRLREKGLHVGLYSSNGTYTCEDLPAGQDHEWQDALQIARWGAEFFKYDFCHNVPLSRYAPLVESISVMPLGGNSADIVRYDCTRAHLDGLAKRMPDSNMPCGCYVSGLDRAQGKMVYDSVYVEQDGEYVLTVRIRKKGNYEKFLVAQVNDTPYFYRIPPQNFWNYTARFQQVVTLKRGINQIALFNPVATRADSAMIQYYRMGQWLRKASEQVAKERGESVRPIVFSICEWGKNQPWKWGKTAGNMWRTTPDIRPWWPWIVTIYDMTVKHYGATDKHNWNDPDMLEVGNGNLTEAENRAHFTLWCMMHAPLILGNDLRKITHDVLAIVTNRALIAIDQDALGKPCKRIVHRCGGVDVLVKPLADGSAAVCMFNRSRFCRTAKFDLRRLIGDPYVQLADSKQYDCTELWQNTRMLSDGTLQARIAPHDVAVFRVYPAARNRAE